jgi:hypothetical protein
VTTVGFAIVHGLMRGRVWWERLVEGKNFDGGKGGEIEGKD